MSILVVAKHADRARPSVKNIIKDVGGARRAGASAVSALILLMRLLLSLLLLLLLLLLMMMMMRALRLARKRRAPHEARVELLGVVQVVNEAACFS